MDERVRPVGQATIGPESRVPAGGRPSLEAQGVYKIFVPRGGSRARPMTALRDINLDVRPGEFLSLIGPSGCGKSTVLNMFAGLTAPTEGRILHDGRAVESVNTRVGYVTQDDNLLPWRTTLANVEIALELKRVPRESRRARALEYLGRVGLRGFEHHYPHELSGGMRKRASIVRTLVDESVNVILMDEPLGPLDAQTRLLLQDELLQLWQGSGRTVVFVTHDLVEAIALSRPDRDLHQRPRPHQGDPGGEDPPAPRRLPHPRVAGLRGHLRRHLERPAGRDSQGPRGGACLSAITSAALLAREADRARRAARTDRLRVLAGQALLLALLLGGWTWASGRIVDRLFLSDPVSIAQAFWAILLKGTLWYHLRFTLTETLLGYVIGAGLGLAGALAVSMIPAGEPVPPPLRPAGVRHAEDRAGAAHDHLVRHRDAAEGHPGRHLRLLRRLPQHAGWGRDGAAAAGLGGARHGRRARWPSSGRWCCRAPLPFIVTALRLTIPAALIGAIIGEFISSNRGVGYLINAASSRYETAEVFAGIGSLLVLVLCMNAGLSLLERSWFRWAPRDDALVSR